MIRCVRIWTGEDGDSLFEEGWIDLAEGVRGDSVGQAIPVVELSFQETGSGGSYEWHQDRLDPGSPVSRTLTTPAARHLACGPSTHLCSHSTTISDMSAFSSGSVTLRQSLTEADRLRIRQLASFVRTQETASLLTILAPRLKPAQRAAVTRTCSFIHAGLLIFPADLTAAIAELPGLGVTPGPLVPSVVIRQRLAGRCAPAAGPQVWITHAAVTRARGRDLELFLATGNEPILATIAQDERASNQESHFALEGTGSPTEMAQLREILAGAGKLLPDGGGYNPHENPARGGRTVLYFRAPDQATLPWPPRTELVLDGHHPQLLAIHQDRTRAA
jgi:hypothetical protein